MLRHNSIIVGLNLLIAPIREDKADQRNSIRITLWDGSGPCHQLSCIKIIGVVNDNSGATKKLHDWTIERPNLQHRAAGLQALQQIRPRGNRGSIIPIASTLLLPMQSKLRAAQSPQFRIALPVTPRIKRRRKEKHTSIKDLKQYNRLAIPRASQKWHSRARLCILNKHR